MPPPEFDLQPERPAKLLLIVIPNCCLKILYLSFINGLVKLSATISALGIKLTIIRFYLYKSRILLSGPVKCTTLRCSDEVLKAKEQLSRGLQACYIDRPPPLTVPLASDALQFPQCAALNSNVLCSVLIRRSFRPWPR